MESDDPSPSPRQTVPVLSRKKKKADGFDDIFTSSSPLRFKNGFRNYY